MQCSVITRPWPVTWQMNHIFVRLRSLGTRPPRASRVNLISPCVSVRFGTMNSINRRQFVEVCAGAAAGATLLPALARAASASPSVQFPSDPRERVAVAEYPFREFIVGWKGWDGKSPSSIPASQQIELKDFAAHVVAKFNVHKIEPWSRIFPSTEPRYLD